MSPATVWRWIDAGKLPAYRVGVRKIRIRAEDLQDVVRRAGRRLAILDPQRLAAAFGLA